MRIFAQNKIEAATTSRCQNGPAIMLAHSRDSVGVKNAAFERIEPPEEFDAGKREKPFRQIH